jgi:hypothetical protein
MTVLRDEASVWAAKSPSRTSGLYAQTCITVLPVLMALTGMWLAGPDAS